MELNRKHFPAIIFYNFRRELTQQQCIDEINSIIGHWTSVYRWYGEFNRGRSSLQDEFHEGRPNSVVDPETIDAMRQLIFRDRHVTYREIETTLGISGTSIYSILHGHFTAKKIFSRLVKRMLQKYDRIVSKHVYDIMTGDELRIYVYEPESK